MKNKSKKQSEFVQYAIKIQSHLAKLFEEDCEVSIDADDFKDSDKLKAFIHALANVVPANMFNTLTGDDKNHLEFNHLANQLCFEYSQMENTEE